MEVFKWSFKLIACYMLQLCVVEGNEIFNQINSLPVSAKSFSRAFGFIKIVEINRKIPSEERKLEPSRSVQCLS